MKKYAHFYVLSACILIAAVVICFGELHASGGKTSAGDDYRMEKLNEVNDKVLNREIVDEDYLYYLSDNEALCTSLREYNQATASLSLEYAKDATGICTALFYEHKEDPGDYDQPMLYYEWVGRITRLALYRNCEELCDTDPFLCYTLSKEAGGSYGLWAARMHLTSPERIQQSEEYFSRIDSLLAELDEYRRSLS